MSAAASLAAAPRQRSNARNNDVSLIPYHHNPMIVISIVVAMLAPLSIFVLSMLFTAQQQQQQQNNNNEFFFDEMDDMDMQYRHLQKDCINATATEDATLTATWDAVKLTSMVASSVAVLCAMGFELFRRDPIVGKYVYDRKRIKEPDRTPPPLMLSRSLWAGYDNDDDKDDNNNNNSSGGAGCKKEMTCWKVKPAILELLFINLDHKYVRYSKAADEARKKREERGQYTTCCRTGLHNHNCCFCIKRKLRNERNDDLFVDEDGYEYYPGHDYTLADDVIAKRFEGEWSKTMNDLFPAESKGGTFDSVVEIEESVVTTCLDEQDNTDADPESSLAIIDGSEHEIIAEEGLDNADPESLAFLDGSEHEIVAEEGLDTDCKFGGDGSLNNDGSGKKMAYPYRLVYLFMPPGFHVWNNALPYISHFFCFPSIARRFNMIFGRATSDDSDDYLSLTEPEQELLHFVGLDIYLLIRFTRLGFDVTYYPFLVACVAVLPVYYVAAKDSSNNNYLSNTINNIENGNGSIWVVVVFSVAFFLYVLRRLWIEWEIFIQLRHDFLARGTRYHSHSSSIKEKYQKTCMVECVPNECRTDAALFNSFNKLFPNQIECAEMLAETSKLEVLVNERKKLIARHESADSLYRYKCWKNTRIKPDEPKVC